METDVYMTEDNGDVSLVDFIWVLPEIIGGNISF